jgi:hypothetical protein
MGGQIVQPDMAFRELVDLVKGGECVLFLGAGIHAPAPDDSKYKYPDDVRPLLGGELAEKLAEQCDYLTQLPQESPRDLQRVSLCYQYTKGLDRTKLVSVLDKHLMAGKKPSPLLKMLAALPFRLLVTTNYDRLIEAALRQKEKDPTVVIYNPDPDKPTQDPSQDPTSDRPLMFKMHGDLQTESSIVITDEDYITFVQRMADKEAIHPVPSTIRYRMSKWRTLFVGYSLRDYNLRLLFRTLRWRLDQSNFPCSFSIDRHPDPLILQVWQNERRFITFVPQDLWSFVPWLYKEVLGKEYADA